MNIHRITIAVLILLKSLVERLVRTSRWGFVEERPYSNSILCIVLLSVSQGHFLLKASPTTVPKRPFEVASPTDDSEE